MQMSLDLFNYLLRQRIIFIAGYINDKVRLGPLRSASNNSGRHATPLCQPQKWGRGMGDTRPRASLCVCISCGS